MRIRTALSFLAIAFGMIAFAQTPEELANAQLEAYNNRDIEAFLIPYSDSVKVYNDTREMLYQGKDIMREQYGAMFDQAPDLNCTLLNRIAVGNTVIEHEEVIFGGRKVYAIVMYRVGLNKIQEVHFLGRQ
ncbi:nuclear transport factor 2 family protein [Ekhidna sp. To15]|uniref:nuclear transport factor 2 family protein n=1 Tax=Ekhidna sp. To15 TaxID=3395267 RepID=UPI003F5281B7